MYSNILVPVAFEEGARPEASIKVALALASQGATITLLHAFESAPSYAMHYIPPDLMKATRDGIQSELDAVAKDLPGGRPYLSRVMRAGRSATGPKRMAWT